MVVSWSIHWWWWKKGAPTEGGRVACNGGGGIPSTSGAGHLLVAFGGGRGDVLMWRSKGIHLWLWRLGSLLLDVEG